MTTVADVDVQSALNDRLHTDFPSTPIAWENVKYTPVPGTPYLRAWLLPAEPRVMTLGPSPVIHRTGIFQVDCFYPAGAGWGTAKAKAALVVATYKAGTRWVYNGLAVQSERAWPGPAMDDDQGWYHIPVSIRYTCYFID